MRRARAAAIVPMFAFAVAMAPPRADACGNAVLRDDPRVRLLVEADAALDRNELEGARAMAKESLELAKGPEDALEQRRLADRARRILALSHVRDPDARQEELTRAEATLRDRIEDPKRLLEVAEQTDHAEAQARLAPMEAEAYATLKKIYARDLLGSPHALGALHRLAVARGDHAMASMALETCTTFAGSSETCEGKLTKRRTPFFSRPRTTERVFFGGLLLMALGVAMRWVAGRRHEVNASTNLEGGTGPCSSSLP